MVSPETLFVKFQTFAVVHCNKLIFFLGNYQASVSETASDSIYKWKCGRKNVSSRHVKKSLSQYLHVQFEVKVETDKPTKPWIFYSDAFDNVHVFTHSYDHIPSAEYLTHSCHDDPLYNNNIYCLLPSY